MVSHMVKTISVVGHLLGEAEDRGPLGQVAWEERLQGSTRLPEMATRDGVKGPGSAGGSIPSQVSAVAAAGGVLPRPGFSAGLLKGWGWWDGRFTATCSKLPAWPLWWPAGGIGGYFWLWGRLVGAGCLGPHLPVAESQRGLWQQGLSFPAWPRPSWGSSVTFMLHCCIILILIPTFVVSCFFVRDQSYLVASFKEYLLYTYCALANAEISRAQSWTWIMPTKN